MYHIDFICYLSAWTAHVRWARRHRLNFRERLVNGRRLMRLMRTARRQNFRRGHAGARLPLSVNMSHNFPRRTSPIGKSRRRGFGAIRAGRRARLLPVFTQMLESTLAIVPFTSCWRAFLAPFCAGALMVSLSLSALAQPQQLAPAPQAPAAATPKSGHNSAGRLSKFEARRFRHACRDNADQQGLKGADRDAFLTKCFFGRVSHRALRRDCAKEGEAKGLDKNALREFTRECVKERAAARQKE